MRKKSIPSRSFHNPCSSLQGLTRMFKCDLCGKSFGSGKALGGHKTSHRSQNLLQSLIKKHERNRNINKDITVNITWSLCSSPRRHHGEKQKHCCQVCMKVFPSDKALYGHMRSHNRDRKNVIHPSPTTSSLED
jgi:ribosomal protein S26